MKHVRNGTWKNRKKSKNKNQTYYDYDYLNNILKYYESDPFFVINSLKDYLKLYPDDIDTYCTYASALIMVGKFEEAKKINDSILNRINNEKIKCLQDEKIRYAMFKCKMNELKLLFAKDNNYYERVVYIKDNKKVLDTSTIHEFENLLFFCNARVTPNLRTRDEYKNYLHKQVVEYKEEDFLDHMKKHLMSYESEEKSPAIFYETFEFKKVLNEIKNKANECFYVYRGFFEKTCYFKYDNCGTVDGKIVDYFRVVSFRDTGDLITIYPTEIGENYPCIDLSYLIEENKGNVRKLSRSEKFKQKYGID